MVQVTLKSREVCEVELPCDDTLASLSVRAIGSKCILAIQSSPDGQTWSSPVAHLRVGAEPATVKLSLPDGACKIRALIENASSNSAYVEIDDSLVTPG